MLGMAIEYPRVMMSDRVWEQLKAALEEAKHSRAGAPAEMSDRDFLEAVLYLESIKKWVLARRIEETFWQRNPWRYNRSQCRAPRCCAFTSSRWFCVVLAR
jgi:hypothetical protein